MVTIIDFLKEYGLAMLYTVIAAVTGYAGKAAKNIYSKYIDDRMKENVVKICVKAVEQLHSQLGSEEKLTKCIEASIEMLSEKSVYISDLELRMLIESSVKELK